MTEILLNERIRARTVRLIDDKQSSSVISFHEAMNKARNIGLDLVLVADGDPPVCRILDGDRYRFEKKKTERVQAKRQREMTVEVKEIQLRPVIDENDLVIKAKRAKGFLAEGDKVKVIVKFKGRERSHADRGRDAIARFLAEVGEHKVDKNLSEDGDMMIVLAPMVSKSDLFRQRQKAES